ncbi:MAG: dihydroxyacetone kinase subunit L [Lactobacillales bacterium]|jgi:dihydroxyacetone kinase-like protein|nr:dihydroxyacetone kinase subunit L [Lactobacillales bacterium]
MNLTETTTKEWLKNFNTIIQEKKEYLSELDTPIGDGDHGNNMARGMTAVMESLEQKSPETVQDILKLVAMSLISKVGGASGPLYGTAFLEMSKAAGESSDIASLVLAGLAGIKKRGGAVLGDKTMVDVWEPVSASLTHGNLTEEIIQVSVESTKDLVAKKGRASYVGERAIGHLDPGAVSSGYLFDSLLKAVQS